MHEQRMMMLNNEIFSGDNKSGLIIPKRSSIKISDESNDDEM